MTSQTALAELPTSNEINEAFDKLQERFRTNFHDIFLDDMCEKTVVIIPSLSLDTEILKAVKGAVFYEERLLCLLLLLRMPRTHIVYVTSIPIDSSIIDYYLHLLSGITSSHARERLTLMSCHDASKCSLTEKILSRPRLVRRIKDKIHNSQMTHMACFNVTDLEKKLALTLDIPIFGCDPKLLHLGTKSGSRQIFRKAGVQLPDGFEDIKNEKGITEALAALKRRHPELRKAVVKLEDGFSGDGNAIFYFNEIKVDDKELEETILQQLPFNLKVVAADVNFSQFISKFNEMGGIVETFVDGEIKSSPSVQCRINPVGDTDILSTHDQLLGGESGQVFLGSSFPADLQYTKDISLMAKKVADVLQEEGVLGRFAMDFVSVKKGDAWDHYAIEINLRKGGTTHPFIMLQYLTDGKFNWQEGLYHTPDGQTRCYFSSDNVVNEKYRCLTPYDLIDIAICNHLQYDGARQTGVMFHMIGALSQYGKLGLLCIGKDHAEAKRFYEKTLEVLDKECEK